MGKLKIGIFTQRYNFPNNTFILRQIEGVRNDFDPIVLTSNKPVIQGAPPEYGIFNKEKDVRGILYRVFKKAGGRFAILSRAQEDFFENIIRKNDIRLMHAHYGPSGLEIVPLAKRMKIPLLVSFHGYDVSVMLKNKKYVRQLAEIFDYGQFIAVSEYMAGKLIKAGAERSKISVIYYGVPVENTFVLRKAVRDKIKNNVEIKFLQVSGFAEKKGHSYTLRAFAEFLKYYQNCKLILGGHGSFFDSVKKLTEELKIKNNVVFLGAVKPENVYEVMKDADVFLHHSVTARSGDEEGIPNVIMEAMSSGLPVISTYHSGIPELIEDGVNGYLVEEKNIPMYVEKMKEATESGGDLCMNARAKIVDAFNLEKQNKKIVELYKKILPA